MKQIPASSLSRRAFLEKAATVTAIGLAAPPLTGATRANASRGTGPNSRIHIGLIGCGGMGRVNLDNCARYPDVVVTGACDVWRARRDAVVAQYKETCKPYADYRELLAAPNIDAVIIATPPHWHALQAIAACEAGKDLFLQKPMTLHLGESLAVRNAIRQHDRISQIGTQIHADDNYRRVVESIRAGHIGSIGVARTFNVMNQTPAGVGRAPAVEAPDGLDWDFWCGPAPRRPFNPILASDSYHHGSWMDYSGGWTPGMAPHIIDLPVWALDLGYPTLTSSAGGRYVVQDDGDAYDHHEVHWQYPNFTLTWMSSLTNSYDFLMRSQPTARRLGIYFHGSDATLYANYGMFRVLAEGSRMEGKSLPPVSIPSSPGHEREWLDCIRSRQQPSCSASYHVKVDVPIVLSLLSLKLGRAIRFDPDSERIVGDPEAAQHAVPQYRAPWTFPAQYTNDAAPQTSAALG
jgi:predicted dehydrogenase